jgi:hypothetical protein
MFATCFPPKAARTLGPGLELTLLESESFPLSGRSWRGRAGVPEDGLRSVSPGRPPGLRPLARAHSGWPQAADSESDIWILATYDVVRHVRCRTSCTYDVVRATYDIVLNIARTMSYVRYTGSRRTTSYVRHRTPRTMSYVNLRHRTSHIQHRSCSSQHIVYNVVCQKWTYGVVCT